MLEPTAFLAVLGACLVIGGAGLLAIAAVLVAGRRPITANPTPPQRLARYPEGP